MDPLYKRSISSSSSFGSYPLTSDDADAALEIGIGDVDVVVPKPLDCLQGTLVPPFLSKTYDLVDDPRLDRIISWSETGASFIVWNPVEFSRRILPKNFKHNNLSSFVRQLNTYGFRKIDTDKWEFACESFHKGKRHLLKNIRRRRSPPAQQLPIEAEVDKLQKEKMEMMQEVMELQNQQHGTHQYMEAVNQKLQAAEDRQKQMVSSLAKVLQTPKFKKDRHASRKFIKHQLDDRDNIVPFPKQELDYNVDCDGASVVKQEDIWNSMWDDGGNFEYPEFGLPGGEFSDFWNLADSGAENWMSGEASKSYETNQYGF